MRTERLVRLGVLAMMVGAAATSGGCSTMNNTEKGVGLGAAAGAGVGTLVGAATGNPKTGAVVGGLLGGATGGAIGNSMDRQDQEKRDIQQATAVANAQAAAQAQRMGLTDVVRMSQEGHDEQVIINQIRNTGSTFQLLPSDLDALKQNGVSPRVIIEMQNARPLAVSAPRPVVIRDQPTVIYRDPPVIYVRDRRPPPPPGVWFHYHGCP